MSQPGLSSADLYAAIIATKNKQGIHYKDAWLMEPHSDGASAIKFYNSASTGTTSDTTAFFTGFTSWGIQDNTDWTANTYKTIYSHTGRGLVYCMIACTAGGAETTTFEITLDGVLQTITITNAASARAFLSAAGHSTSGGEFTSANVAWQGNAETLDAATLTTFFNNTSVIPPPKYYANLGVGALRYDISCLIRMKHSTSITNSTATAFSGVLVRKGIAS